MSGFFVENGAGHANIMTFDIHIFILSAKPV
jgi:hypothetical protein